MCEVCGQPLGMARGRDFARPVVCRDCGSGLRRPPPRYLGGLEIRSALVHDAVASRLIRQLKYRGHLGVADFMAARMAPLVPSGARMLVPVPRAWTRRLEFGVDPGLELARSLRQRTGLPVVKALAPPLYGRARAGAASAERTAPALRRRGPVTRAVLVDDVITTGITMSRGAEVLGSSSILAGLTASSAL